MLSPWPSYCSSQIRAVVDVLSSGKVNRWSGSQCSSFESEFSSFIGSKYSRTCSNGSASLQLAYRSLDLSPGDEIVTTPRTFIATSSEALLQGFVPIFADVDRDTGCITAQTIERALTPRTKAISVVHLGGWPADMPQIMDLAKAYGLFVVEDCSQAHGAFIGNQSVGSFAHVSTWSFCTDKIITTCGEGGMVSTNSPEIDKKISSFRDHGKDLDLISTTHLVLFVGSIVIWAPTFD